MEADGEAFGGVADGEDGGGGAEEIEPLGEAHGVEVGEVLRGAGGGVEGPGTFAVAEGGDGADGGEEDGEVAHLVEEAGADEVDLAPGGEELVAGERRLFVGNREEVEEGGAEVGRLSEGERFEEHGAAADEEGVPELAGALEGGGAEGLDVEAVTAEGVDGVVNALAGFGCDGDQAVVFEVADAGVLEGFGGDGL